MISFLPIEDVRKLVNQFISKQVEFEKQNYFNLPDQPMMSITASLKVPEFRNILKIEEFILFRESPIFVLFK